MAAERWIRGPSPEDASCHAGLSARLLVGTNSRDWLLLAGRAGRSLVLNPDGPVHPQRAVSIKRPGDLQDPAKRAWLTTRRA